MHHLDVVLCHGRLPGKLLTQERLDKTEVAVEEPAHQSESKHVATFQDALVVHAAVGKTLLDHLRHGACHHAVAVNAQLSQIVGGLKLCLLQVALLEAVGVDDDGSLWLGV